MPWAHFKIVRRPIVAIVLVNPESRVGETQGTRRMRDAHAMRGAHRRTRPPSPARFPGAMPVPAIGLRRGGVRRDEHGGEHVGTQEVAPTAAAAPPVPSLAVATLRSYRRSPACSCSRSLASARLPCLCNHTPVSFIRAPAP